MKLNLSCKCIPLYFWSLCTLFPTPVNLTDTSSQCYSQVTHLKRNDKGGLKTQACGELYQTNVCKQKAEMAESKSDNNSKSRPLSRGKRYTMRSTSIINECLYTKTDSGKSYKGKTLTKIDIMTIKVTSHCGEFCIRIWWIKHIQIRIYRMQK